MYCPNCGKEYTASTAFCTECGKPLPKPDQSQIVTEASAPVKPKKKYGLLLGALAAAIVVIILITGSGKNDMEYTNNAGDKLAIVVNDISYGDSYWTNYIDINFEIENLTQTDYKEASMAVLAWDWDGYPIRLAGMYELEPDFVRYIGLENISPGASSEETYTFEKAEIGYMAVFLSSYTTYDGKQWENPIMKKVEKSKGQRLTDTELYYFQFQ